MYSVPDGWLSQRGLPHSEISGSKPVSGSPKLIAAVHVLLRLSSPRHPPCALRSLTVTPKARLVTFSMNRSKESPAHRLFRYGFDSSAHASSTEDLHNHLDVAVFDAHVPTLCLSTAYAMPPFTSAWTVRWNRLPLNCSLGDSSSFERASPREHFAWISLFSCQ